MSTHERVCITVEIPVAAEFPSEQEIAYRDAIIAELDKRQVGEFSGCGGGFNMMDFSYLVEDEARMRAEVDVLVPHFLPGWPYTVEVMTEEELLEMDPDPDGQPEWTPLGKVVLVIGALALIGGIVWGLMKWVF